MKITRGQLKEIVSSALNESILLSLLIGCKSECNLSSIAPELKNLKIPECVTEEVYDFKNIDWGSKSMKIPQFTELIESLGYSIGNRRRQAVSSTISGVELSYDDISVIIKNVPYRLVMYLEDNNTIYVPFDGSFGDDELCDLVIYFTIEENENGQDIVLKNNLYTGPGPYDVGGSADHVGHGVSLETANPQCNKSFKAVVANINPKITPDDAGI